MKRFKTIDTARGMAIFGMVVGHMLNWWLTEEDLWIYIVYYIILAPLGVSAFLFISGASTTLAYRKRLILLKESDEFNMQTVRNMFMLRALILLVIALIYNIVGAFLIFEDLTWIWAWNVLQTIAFSLFIIWPLLKTSKILRIILGIILLIANQLIFEFLLPYQGQINFYGILFYILFNPTHEYVILPFFSMFLLGTVLGDFIFELDQIENQEERRAAFKINHIYFIILGVILVIFGILFQFPSFLEHAMFSSMVYSLGLILIIYSTLMFIEELEIIKTKESHRFFYFYSYYSFTIYIAHNLLYFLFLRQLTVITIWIPIIVTMIILTLLIRFVHKKLGPYASIKFGISVISFVLIVRKKDKIKLILANNKL